MWRWLCFAHAHYATRVRVGVAALAFARVSTQAKHETASDSGAGRGGRVSGWSSRISSCRSAERLLRQSGHLHETTSGYLW